MKVYIVSDTDQDSGTTIYHVASSRDKAEEWVKRHAERFRYFSLPDIEEVEVDQDEELCI